MGRAASVAPPVWDGRAGERLVIAEGLGLSSVRVRGYAGVDLNVARGTAHALVAENRSGKTELLLTLAGRMRADSGRLAVDGRCVSTLRDVDWLRRASGLGFFERVNDVERALRVGTVTSAELSLAGRPSRRSDARAYLADWGLADVCDQTVASLPRHTYDLLGIALGMCGEPMLLAVHDVERDLTAQQSAQLVEVLRAIAREHDTTVVCGVCDYAVAARFDEATCLTDGAREQREAYLAGAATAGGVAAAGAAAAAAAVASAPGAGAGAATATAAPKVASTPPVARRVA